MEIRVGAPVAALDDKPIGKVDRLIYEPRSGELYGLVVHRGHLLTHDTLVEFRYLARVEEDGTVRLRVDSSGAAQLPAFIKYDESQPTPAEERDLPYPAGTAVSGPGMTMQPILWRSTYTVRGQLERPLFEPAAIHATAHAVRSNLPADAIAFDHSTSVHDAEGHTVGVVECVQCRDDGVIRAIVVRSGILHHDYATIAADSIAWVTSDCIQLRPALAH